MSEPDHSADGLVVSGKSLRGPIRVGDQFSIVLDSWESEGPTAAGAVDLIVDSIEFYGQPVDEVDEGAGCRLHLAGEGRVHDGSMLVGHVSISEALARFVARTSRVIVATGPSFDARHRRANHVLAEVKDSATIRALGPALVADPTDAAVMTPGDSCIALLAGRSPLLVVTLIRPDLVRCPLLWSLDARLADPSLLAAWLTSQGVD